MNIKTVISGEPMLYGPLVTKLICIELQRTAEKIHEKGVLGSVLQGASFHEY